MIVSCVFSQWLLLETSGSELVKLTSQDTVEDVDTLTVPLDVLWFVPDASFVSVKDSAG